jgi:hypothetical protein
MATVMPIILKTKLKFFLSVPSLLGKKWQMVKLYQKRTISTKILPRPPKIYQNQRVWYANKTFGNPVNALLRFP